jgi:hypothetical protein
MFPEIPIYLNIILAVAVILLAIWIFYRPQKNVILSEPSKKPIETFTGYNDNVAENMDNTYSIKTACNEENPDGNLPVYLQWKKDRCTNGYVDLNRGMLKVPLYMYPALKYHPVYDPFGDFQEFDDGSS